MISRLRLKSFKLLRVPEAAAPPQPLQKSTSTYVSLGKAQPAPFSLKSDHRHSRGYLTRRDTDRTTLTKEASKLSRSRSPVPAQPTTKCELQRNKTRSPSCTSWLI